MFCGVLRQTGATGATLHSTSRVDRRRGESCRSTERENYEPSIPLVEAEQLLFRGFVKSLDELAQEQFLKHVPSPALSKCQAECIRQIQEGSDAEKIKAAKRINSEALNVGPRLGQLSLSSINHNAAFDCCDQNQHSPAVYLELIWTLVFICGRTCQT